MITIFNRVKVITDTQSEEIAKDKVLLKNAGIKFEVKTIRPRGYVGITMDVKVQQKFNQPYSHTLDNIPYVYYIYVARRDSEAAKKVLQGILE
ncbi:MAG: hypothetical protein PHE93_05685 [Clostridia bacterium]|nr:hypothetical protein [Clostridia bacterium]